MTDAMSVVGRLCSVIPDRRPGGEGNRDAVMYVAELFENSGWDVSTPEFDCLDWIGGDGLVKIDGAAVRVVPSPYGLGVDTHGPVRVVTTAEEVAGEDLRGAVVIVAGDLVSEPMTPKSYPFYESSEHTAIIAALETAQPVAIIALTGKHPALCGALDPYPWIEDGNFGIPVAAVRPTEGQRLFAAKGRIAHVEIEATRIASTARNVIAHRGPRDRRVTVCAHIDSKPGTPGAVDNATGVATLVLLAERLASYPELPVGVELLAINGEDHFAGPGEVAWLAANKGTLDAIEMFVNIDGAGYRRGRTAYSFYNVYDRRLGSARNLFEEFDDLVEGPAWYQSDHAIFAMQGRPALAFTTELVEEMLEVLFHSHNDTIDQVSSERIESLATALERFIVDS